MAAGASPRPDIAGCMVGRTHVLAIRVYYEDTDFSGAVYHANYLKFCERGRTDMLRLIGVSHRELMAGQIQGRSLGFVVRSLAADFLRPARIDDLLAVRTRFTGMGGARLELVQEVVRQAETAYRQEITVALVDAAGRPVRIPADLAARVAPYLGTGAADDGKAGADRRV